MKIFYINKFFFEKGSGERFVLILSRQKTSFIWQEEWHRLPGPPHIKYQDIITSDGIWVFL